MSFQPGAIIGGKYRLDRTLARGGMGSVWSAHHTQLGSAVAVKFMDPRFASSQIFRARFEREARAAAGLQSPHVVGVQDYGIHEGAPYIVMELLKGEDLHRRLERYGRLPIDDVWPILVQLGKALRRAHDAGLVHRDLKPRNVYLARIDEEEVVKILDFGIAKETGTSIANDATKTGEIMGSPHYMSPEQLKAERDLDTRSDLWSVAVILFRALTGKLPFPGEALGAVMAKILVDPVPPVSTIAPDLPPALDGFFARALSREREGRYQTIRELVDAFGQIVGGVTSGAGLTGTFASPYAAPPGPVPIAPPIGAAASPPSPALSSASGPFTAGHALLTPLPPPPVSPAQFTFTPPAGLNPASPVGTLTTAGVIDAPGGAARRLRAVWAAAIGAFLLVATIGTVTVLRFGGKDEADEADEAPAGAPDSAAAAAPEVPQADPEPSMEPAPPAVEPEPSADPEPSAEPAPSAQPSVAEPKVHAPVAGPTATQAKPVKPPVAPATGRPAPSTTTKRPAWGF